MDYDILAEPFPSYTGEDSESEVDVSGPRAAAIFAQYSEATIDCVRQLITSSCSVIHWGCTDGKILRSLRYFSKGQMTGVYAECIPVNGPLHISQPGSSSNNTTWYRKSVSDNTNPDTITTFDDGILHSLIENKPAHGYRIAIVGKDLVQNGERNDTTELLRPLKSLLAPDGFLVVPWSLGDIDKGGVMSFSPSLPMYMVQNWHYVPADAKRTINEKIKVFAKDQGYDVYKEFEPDTDLDEFVDLSTTVPTMFTLTRARDRNRKMSVALARWVVNMGSAHYATFQQKGRSLANVKDLVELPNDVPIVEFARQRWPVGNPLAGLARCLVNAVVYVDSNEDVKEYVDAFAAEPGADTPKIVEYTGYAVLQPEA